MPSIDYYINDPVAPIKVKTTLPTNTPLKYTVGGYNGKTSTPLQLQSTNCYISIGNSIINRMKNISKVKKIKGWAATTNLSILPRAGQDFNAYYDRRFLKFFYQPIGKTVIYTVDSSDVVTHELGHALLDAMRPDFWSVQALEIWAFHESFADINAILTMMDYPEVLQAVIKETNGNLRKSNIITRLAEQLGLVAYGKGHLYLRDAVNSFKYQSPKNLPSDGPEDTLYAECHSFGKIFVGTWWDIVCGIYEQEIKQDQLTAITLAKNIAADYLYKAIAQSPLTSTYHHAIAKGMLLADQSNGNKYQEVLKKVFTNRNLLTTIKVLATTDVSKKEMLKKLKKNDVVTKRGKVTSITIKKNKTIKLLDFHSKKKLSALSMLGQTHLGDVKLEVPADHYYEFDADGQLQDLYIPNEEDTIEEALICTEMIASAGVGDGKMWKITRNKLVRKRFESIVPPTRGDVKVFARF